MRLLMKQGAKLYDAHRNELFRENVARVRGGTVPGRRTRKVCRGSALKNQVFCVFGVVSKPIQGGQRLAVSEDNGEEEEENYGGPISGGGKKSMVFLTLLGLYRSILVFELVDLYCLKEAKSYYLIAHTFWEFENGSIMYNCGRILH